MKRIVSIGLLLLLSLAASAVDPNSKCIKGSKGCVTPDQSTTVTFPDYLIEEAPKKASKVAPEKEAAAPEKTVSEEKGSVTGTLKKVWSELQKAMWVQVKFYQIFKPVTPDKLCEKYPNLCEEYKVCLKNAQIALENSQRSCPLPSQSSGLEYFTPIAQEREEKCVAIVLAGEMLITRKGKDGNKAGVKSQADGPEASMMAGIDDADSDSDSKTESTPGEHNKGEAHGAKSGRSPANSTKPVYEACGEEGSPLTSRMDKGKLLPHSVYQITVRTDGEPARWIPSQSGEGTECLRVLTDQHGDIRGRMVLSGFPGGKVREGRSKEREHVRSRFLGRQLPNPNGKLLPNRLYDSFVLPGGKQKFVFAACDNQNDFRLPLISLIQSSPSAEGEVQIVGLKFVGEKTDPSKVLAFTDVPPSDIRSTLPKVLGSKEAIAQSLAFQKDETISMAAFVEDK